MLLRDMRFVVLADIHGNALALDLDRSTCRLQRMAKGAETRQEAADRGRRPDSTPKPALTAAAPAG